MCCRVLRANKACAFQEHPRSGPVYGWDDSGAGWLSTVPGRGGMSRGMVPVFPAPSMLASSSSAPCRLWPSDADAAEDPWLPKVNFQAASLRHAATLSGERGKVMVTSCGLPCGRTCKTCFSHRSGSWAGLSGTDVRFRGLTDLWRAPLAPGFWARRRLLGRASIGGERRRRLTGRSPGRFPRDDQFSHRLGYVEGSDRHQVGGCVLQ